MRLQILVAVIRFLALFERCPRQLLGYHCHGPRCDHSREELRRVRRLNSER